MTDVIQLKSCSHCGDDKPLDEFHRNATARDGRQWYCKTCDNGRKRPSTDPDVIADALALHAAGVPLSCDQIAAVLKLSVVRVQQLERNAMAKLLRRARRYGLDLPSQPQGFLHMGMD